MSRSTLPKSQDLGTNAIDAVNHLVDQVTALVGKPPALSAADIRRSAKLRKGGETVIPTVAALSDQFGLSLPSHPTAAMLEKLTKAQSLIPLHKKMVTALKQVTDAIFSAQSESWAATTVHYSMLRRLAKTDGDLEAAIAPIEQFFAHRSPAVVQAEKAKRGHRKGAKAKAVVAKANPAAEQTNGAQASEVVSTTGTHAEPSSATATPEAASSNTTHP